MPPSILLPYTLRPESGCQKSEICEVGSAFSRFMQLQTLSDTTAFRGHLKFQPEPHTTCPKKLPILENHMEKNNGEHKWKLQFIGLKPADTIWTYNSVRRLQLYSYVTSWLQISGVCHREKRKGTTEMMWIPREIAGIDFMERVGMTRAHEGL